MQDTPGLVTAMDGASGLIVGIDTTLTPDLKAEGTAREIVHVVQNMRRSAGFDIEDRIEIYVGGADDAIAAVLDAHGAYIGQETLAESLSRTSAPAGAHVEQQAIDGVTLTLGVTRRQL